MSARGKRNALLAIAAAIVAVGVVVAIATTGGGGHRHASVASASHPARVGSASQIAAASSYLGVSSAKLRHEMRSGHTLAQIAATHGKSTAGLIDALAAQRAAQLRASTGKKLTPAQVQARVTILRKRLARQIARVPGYVGLPASARYLGISPAQLRAELQAGRSLAQIADATPGKSASGLIDARVSSREAAIKAALASGRISKTTAATLLSSLRQRITNEVQHTLHS